MSRYVEKLVIHLHPTFKNSRREYKSPPFILKEQGYATFEITLEIQFKGLPSSDPAKKVGKHDLN